MSALSCLNIILSSTNFLLKNHTIEKKYLDYFKWAYVQFRAPTALAEELLFDSWGPHAGQLTTSSNYIQPPATQRPLLGSTDLGIYVHMLT